MKYILSPRNLNTLDKLQPGRSLLAIDFDGTLAPIVEHADMARTPAASARMMRRLAARLPVAVISGRSVKDLQKRLGFTPAYLIGNHGLEFPGEGEAAAAAAARISTGWRRQLSEDWEDVAGDPGVFVEDKLYSLSLHYRLARDPRLSRARLMRKVARLRPAPRVIPGKALFNLTPRNVAHKGTALLRALDLSGAENAVFIGDDATDEDVFRLARRNIVKIKVGLSRSSRADYYLRGQAQVAVLLKELSRRFA
jgi:trehalose 6-phosphate phosphatase